jgi:tetraprenyl-beta-curcumene synthase
MFADRRLLARAGIALVLANLRFWPTVAPQVSRQLARWRSRAREIEDPKLRALALQKLDEEHFNAEVAATLATLAPASRRRQVIEAIVAYEVMYDYLDGLTEQPTQDPLRDGRHHYRPFIKAICLQPHADRNAPGDASDGYLHDLSATVQNTLAQLPAASAIVDVAEGTAERCAEAQIRAHAAPTIGSGQLQAWAERQSAGTTRGWREFLAGAASSVLAVHALIAAASDPRTTAQEAAEIDAVYMSICTLSTMLDSLIDQSRDELAGQDSYLRYYDSPDQIAEDLVHAAREAALRAAPLRHAAHHVMTVVGVTAYYASALQAQSALAQPVLNRVTHELEPLITPTLAVMRTWRAAKQVRRSLPPRESH